MQRPNNKKIKDSKEPSFGVVNYATENIGKEVFYSEEEKKLLHRSLVDDSKKYLNSELAYKLKKKDKALYKVLYTKIPGNIQNHDFYTAFRNVKLNELVNPQEENENDEENCNQTKFKFPQSLFVYNHDRYNDTFINERYDSNHPNREYPEWEMYCIDWPNTIAFYIFLFLILFLPVGGSIISCVIDHHSEQDVMICGITITEVVLLVLLIKIFKKRKIKKSHKLKYDHPYYDISDGLHYYSIRFTDILYPANKIEEKYRKSRKAIEKEWNKYSINAFTNIMFRFKPIAIDTDYNYYFRLFIEIDYKECFPNYPELLIIEKQTESFIHELFSGYQYDDMIQGYKKQLENYISKLLSERIPDMDVKDIRIAVVKKTPG